MNLDNLLNKLNLNKILLQENYNLNLKAGIFWAIVWVLILLVLGKKPLWIAITSGFSFFIFWLIISIILMFSCEYYKLCL